MPFFRARFLVESLTNTTAISKVKSKGFGAARHRIHARLCSCGLWENRSLQGLTRELGANPRRESTVCAGLHTSAEGPVIGWLPSEKAVCKVDAAMQRAFEDVSAAGGVDCVSQETYRKAQGLRRSAKPSYAGKRYPHRRAFHSPYDLLSLQGLPFSVFSCFPWTQRARKVRPREAIRCEKQDVNRVRFAGASSCRVCCRSVLSVLRLGFAYVRRGSGVRMWRSRRGA